MSGLSKRIKAPAERLHLHKKTRHDWRWVELPKEAQRVRKFTHFTDNSNR